ncbi:NACHT domain-containing protein [Actinoplanes sp. Pm04-4]|uniref:NACHT domain-containing protein n=1 Tax=Paractinoplanes pyxinae TaxID=2997416 RepID=A0ABT4B508_9ACTN|nr:NACHT domain-containing protein [Actinoplanes pyxinae]MCY1141572.1 NACHT domain-containing protein [Actinoplanes pyxinae]
MRWRQSLVIVAGVLAILAWDVSTNLLANIIPMRRAFWPVLLVVIGLLIAYLAGAQRDSERRNSSVDLDRVADDLAETIAATLRNDEEQRRVTQPAPLPVRWHEAGDGLADHPGNVTRTAIGSQGPALDVDDRLERIATVYGRIPSRRLVVLGEAGSGKTVLAGRLARGLLTERSPGQPVPVVVNVASWNPSVPLREWLAGKIERDHPRTAQRYAGRQSIAAALVETGRVLPLLDGFDEISQQLQADALRQLSEASDSPLVVTCRPEEYTQATLTSTVLSHAAVVELEDLDLPDVLDYLSRTVRPESEGRAGMWTAVVALVRDDPNGESATMLREALKNPLMVFLARSIYSDAGEADAAELVDSHRFPRASDIQRHLVAAYVPARYRATGSRPSWRLDHVQHWLAHLADDLDRRGTRELAWWQMADSIPARSRALIACVPLVLVSLAFWTLVLSNFVMGLNFCVLASLLYGAYFVAPGPPPARVSWTWRRPARIVVRYARNGLLIGLAGGLLLLGPAIFFSRPLPATVSPLWQAAAYAAFYALGPLCGVGFGAIVGVFAAIASGLEDHVDLTRSTDPAQSLTADRARSLARIAVIGLLLTLLAIPTAGWWAGIAWAVPVSALLVLRDSAWMRWLLFVRCWLPLQGRLPWRVAAFLNDTHQRGVLRRSGAVYVFRHALLHEHLAATARNTRQRHTRRWSPRNRERHVAAKL